MLFPLYCAGMALALILNVSHLRAFSLRFFYAVVIIYAHFVFLPPTGPDFYIECLRAQFWILLAALVFRCEAAYTIAALAFFACMTNLLSYHNYPSHEGIWPFYYSIINTVQVLQIGCLIFVSPVTLPIIKRILSRKKKGIGLWIARALVA